MYRRRKLSTNLLPCICPASRRKAIDMFTFAEISGMVPPKRKNLSFTSMLRSLREPARQSSINLALEGGCHRLAILKPGLSGASIQSSYVEAQGVCLSAISTSDFFNSFFWAQGCCPRGGRCFHSVYCVHMNSASSSMRVHLHACLHDHLLWLPRLHTISALHTDFTNRHASPGLDWTAQAQGAAARNHQSGNRDECHLSEA